MMIKLFQCVHLKFNSVDVLERNDKEICTPLPETFFPVNKKTITP